MLPLKPPLSLFEFGSWVALERETTERELERERESKGRERYEVRESLRGRRAAVWWLHEVGGRRTRGTESWGGTWGRRVPPFSPPLIGHRGQSGFNFFSWYDFPILPPLNGLKSPFYPLKKMGFYILPSLKKFCSRNLKCSTSPNPTNRDASLLKIFSHMTILAVLIIEANHIIHKDALEITTSSLNSTIHLKKVHTILK